MSSRTKRFDLVSIGGGTAGLIATLGVAGMGGRAALIEEHRTGGDCLWTGCVPSKAVIAAANAAHSMRTADRHGLDPVSPRVDLARVMAAARRAQAVIEHHDSPERLRAGGVEVIEGRGRFIGPGRIAVDDYVLNYRSALVATGSQPIVPSIEGLAAAEPLTSETVWSLTTLPERLVVLGGGASGCELGQAFGRLGSEVTIVEAADHLLPKEPPEIGRFLAECLTEEGIDVRTGATAMAVTSADNGWSVNLGDGATVGFDRILVAVGRRPNTSYLGLDQVGVELNENGFVEVDYRMATTGDHIFAAGDVTGVMPFTHVAGHQAKAVITNALFGTRRGVSYRKVPWVTFTDPEIARVGLDADSARRRWGDGVIVQRHDYAQLDRAVTDATNRGWAELVGDPKRRLVGATIVGAGAGEAIAELTAWITTGAKIDAVSNVAHAYPTFAEGPARAADDLIRARYFNPRVTLITRPLLGVLRRLDRPR